MEPYPEWGIALSASTGAPISLTLHVALPRVVLLCVPPPLGNEMASRDKNSANNVIRAANTLVAEEAPEVPATVVATRLHEHESRSGLLLEESRVILCVEARAGLVPASVFKTDEASRERRLGGFDSLAFPPY